MRTKEACPWGPSGASHGGEDARLLVDRLNGNAEGFTLGKQLVGVTPSFSLQGTSLLSIFPLTCGDLLTQEKPCILYLLPKGAYMLLYADTSTHSPCILNCRMSLPLRPTKLVCGRTLRFNKQLKSLRWMDWNSKERKKNQCINF